MLKIKDNVDLKELENYGFKPKYDTDTGKLCSYKHYKYEFVYVSLRDRELNASSSIYEEEKPINDLLYDLIQAGIIEKVVK